ncbi:MAG: arsenate reductase family protein [Bacteroidota bacterium]
MGEIATSNRQITIYYNPESVIAEKTLIFAKAEGFAILEIDILKTPLTGTQIAELSSRLNLEVKDLVNQEHDSYKLKFESHNFSTDDWIKMIRNNPEIMRQPIALRGDTTVLVLTPTDILKL